MSRKTKEERAAEKILAALDKDITRSYTSQATGRTINIMDIPSFFKAVRAAVAVGATVDSAVAENIGKFCN